MTDDKPWESSSLVERLKWWAFKFYGKGYRETMASDAMTEAHERIEKLEEALRWITEQEGQTAHPTVCAIVKAANEALEGKDD
jgi:hypothetical protein